MYRVAISDESTLIAFFQFETLDELPVKPTN